MFSKRLLLMLNDIIYKIHTQENYLEMREIFLESLRYIIPYQFSTFYLASHDRSQMLCDPVGVDIAESELTRYLDAVDQDYSKGLFTSGRSMIYKESDIFPKKDFENTMFYNEAFRKNKLKDALTISIANHGVFLGVITLCRTTGMPDFSELDIFAMEILMPHLESRLSKEHAKNVHRDAYKTQLDTIMLKDKYCLTERECEVLLLLLEGNSIDDICQICTISSNTLRKHTMNIYRKLGIHSRPELAKLFYEL